MKVLHSGSLDVKAGGPALSTYLSIKGLIDCGIDVEMVLPPISEGKLIADDVKMHYTAPIKNARWDICPG